MGRINGQKGVIDNPIFGGALEDIHTCMSTLSHEYICICITILYNNFGTPKTRK
jgi:hypothetical protein